MVPVRQLQCSQCRTKLLFSHFRLFAKKTNQHALTEVPSVQRQGRKMVRSNEQLTLLTACATVMLLLPQQTDGVNPAIIIKPTIPGCPAWPPGLVTTCQFDPNVNCINDAQCGVGAKCCPWGCGSVCFTSDGHAVPPCTGGATVNRVQNRLFSKSDDFRCIDQTPKPGVCPLPVPLRKLIFACPLRFSDCNGDWNCPDDLKCCSNGCGLFCQKPAVVADPPPPLDPCSTLLCPANQVCKLQQNTASAPVPVCVDQCVLPCPLRFHCELQTIACTARFPIGSCVSQPVCVRDKLSLDSCADYTCGFGQQCQMIQVECLVAPCPPPFPKCVDVGNPFSCDAVKCPSSQCCQLQPVKCGCDPCPVVPKCGDCSKV